MPERVLRRAGKPAAADEVAWLVIDLTNEFRVQQDRNKVAANARLTEAARYFAGYIAKTGRFSHDADGTVPAARAQKFGYDYCIVSENLAYREVSGQTPARELAEKKKKGGIKKPKKKKKKKRKKGKKKKKKKKGKKKKKKKKKKGGGVWWRRERSPGHRKKLAPEVTDLVARSAGPEGAYYAVADVRPAHSPGRSKPSLATGTKRPAATVIDAGSSALVPRQALLNTHSPLD